MKELIKEIKKFNAKFKEEYVINTNFTELYDLSQEIEFLYESGMSYEQILFKKFGFDYDKENVVIAISKELINLYE